MSQSTYINVETASESHVFDLGTRLVANKVFDLANDLGESERKELVFTNNKAVEALEAAYAGIENLLAEKQISFRVPLVKRDYIYWIAEVMRDLHMGDSPTGDEYIWLTVKVILEG